MPTDPSEPTRVSLTASGDDRWTGYVFRLSYLAGQVSALEIRRDDDAAPLTAHHLQRVPLGALDRAARRCVEDFLEVWERPEALRALYPDPRDWLEEVADGSSARTMPDVDLAQLCRRYLEVAGASDWRETLAQEFGYSPSSVQTIVARARKRRFLTRVQRGQTGGQLTPKSLRLLAPPKLRPAWDRATEDQRAAAVARNERQARIAAEFLEQLRAGEVDDATYEVRSLALDAEVVGWAAEDLYPDHPALADINREIRFIQDHYPQERS